jgi:NADPH-dependent glutamate synthase beta subunit-like oxidoreductase/NAD-dependent dihydropyrimidine dehydrogenase PreA subunit
LPGDEVTEAIAMLEKMNVTFETGRCLGENLDAEKLEREWDAVLLAMGLGSALRLGIAGEELPGVYQGLDLLRDIRCGKNPEIGQSVIVIGGGNTAIDAAVSCRRLGAREVTMICLEEKGQMPAFPSEIADALEEGVKIKNGYGPREFIRHTDELLRVGLSRCLRLFDEEGRFQPVLDASCELSPPAHSIVVAIGQKLRPAGIPADLFGPAASRLQADSRTLQTKRRKVFAAGDIVAGPSSVIEAMAQGREAAISIDRLLAGDTLEWGRVYAEGTCVTHFRIDHKGAIVRSRAALPRLPTSSRNIRDEIEKTMDAKTAREEAERCLSCGHPGEVNQTCWYCLPCEIECPAEALEVRIPYLVR